MQESEAQTQAQEKVEELATPEAMSGLSEHELEISTRLSIAWERFAVLPNLSQSDYSDFAAAMNTQYRIIAKAAMARQWGGFWTPSGATEADSPDA